MSIESLDKIILKYWFENEEVKFLATMLSKKALLVSDYENYKFCLVVSNGVKQRKNRAHYDNVLYFNTFICELQIQFKAKDFTPRTPETYDYHCSLLNGPLGRENAKTYGITYMRVLYLIILSFLLVVILKSACLQNSIMQFTFHNKY